MRLTYKLSHHAPPTDQLDIDSNLANVLPPSGLIRAPAVGTSQQHELFTSCVMPKEGLLKASIEDDTRSVKRRSQRVSSLIRRYPISILDLIYVNTYSGNVFLCRTW